MEMEMEDEFRRSRSELSDERSRRLLLISYYCFLSLSHTKTESLKNLAPRKKLHREMKQKKIHVSEIALGGFVLVNKLQH